MSASRAPRIETGITVEQLNEAIAAYLDQNVTPQIDVLRKDNQILQKRLDAFHERLALAEKTMQQRLSAAEESFQQRLSAAEGMLVLSKDLFVTRDLFLTLRKEFDMLRKDVMKHFDSPSKDSEKSDQSGQSGSGGATDGHRRKRDWAG